MFPYNPTYSKYKAILPVDYWLIFHTYCYFPFDELMNIESYILSVHMFWTLKLCFLPFSDLFYHEDRLRNNECLNLWLKSITSLVTNSYFQAQNVWIGLINSQTNVGRYEWALTLLCAKCRKKQTCIYNFYHSFTLTWHRWLKAPLV